MKEVHSKLNLIKPTLQEMGIEPNKGAVDYKIIVKMAKTIGLDLSFTQAIEALFHAKGDTDKFVTPLNDKEYKRFIEWFFTNKRILRLKKKNYMKISTRQYNNSINVRPSIMIKKAQLDDSPGMNHY